MKIAIIGSGISGLSAALLLSQKHQITIFEIDKRYGGHANTVQINDENTIVNVDTGFIVFNKLNYPNLVGFLKHLDIELTVVATQIEPHDYMAELFQNIQRINTIILDLNRDIWTYISLDYFSLKMSKNEVGSSTMPHKVNPIDFENAEGNIGLSNAIFSHLSEKLPVSRLQRDLSDSTVLRNIGTAYGYMEIAINSTLKGLGKLEANKEAISNDLEERYELLTEPLQSFLRLEGKKDGYDQVKHLSRGQKMDKEMYLKAVEELIDNNEYKRILVDLTPSKYIGLAAKLAEMK